MSRVESGREQVLCDPEELQVQQAVWCWSEVTGGRHLIGRGRFSSDDPPRHKAGAGWMQR